MVQTIQDFAKKYGIWAALFISLLVWMINGYEKREVEYQSHEEEYHKIISDNTKVMQDSQRLMQDNTKIMEGYKVILEVKLDQIQKEIELIRGGKN